MLHVADGMKDRLGEPWQVLCKYGRFVSLQGVTEPSHKKISHEKLIPFTKTLSNKHDDFGAKESHISVWRSSYKRKGFGSSGKWHVLPVDGAKPSPSPHTTIVISQSCLSVMVI